jgi:ABC-type transporter Mla subunit MlaD
VLAVDEQFIQTFVSELRLGFAQVVDRLDQNNASIERINSRLDQTNARLDQTNGRLDQTIIRLDRLDMNVELLRAETREKFDGIGRYLKSINGHIWDHGRG